MTYRQRVALRMAVTIIALGFLAAAFLSGFVVGLIASGYR